MTTISMEEANEFNIVVNPFIHEAIIVTLINNCTYVETLYYNDCDYWSSFEIGGKSYDIHFLFDSNFIVSIYATSEAPCYVNPEIIHLSITLGSNISIIKSPNHL